jgi:sulfate/thiosulfate transport system substrate-binding protein
MRLPFHLVLALISGIGLHVAFADDASLLNVSYDPTRELYQEYNLRFAEHWKQKTGQVVAVKSSHGGSGKQARAVIDGLQADVVTLALAYDIDVIAEKAQLLPVDWAKRLPDNSSPYTSTIVFLVRKGNPKQIKEWNDLIKPGVGIIPANPKTSGGARWTYLAAYGQALLANGGDQAKARAYIAKFYDNVPVLDSGARGATTTFVERGIGDVLVGWENEALQAIASIKDQFEVVVPATSILAEPPVALVDQNADHHGTRAVAEEYLYYLYSDVGQEIAAKNFYRPRKQSILAKYANQFSAVKLFTLAEAFRSWGEAQKIHFADGGVFDQIYQPK